MTHQQVVLFLYRLVKLKTDFACIFKNLNLSLSFCFSVRVSVLLDLIPFSLFLKNKSVGGEGLVVRLGIQYTFTCRGA